MERLDLRVEKQLWLFSRSERRSRAFQVIRIRRAWTQSASSVARPFSSGTQFSTRHVLSQFSVYPAALEDNQGDGQFGRGAALVVAAGLA